MSERNDTLGFIGGGNMARAIATGLVDGGFPAADLLIAEPSEAARTSLGTVLGGAEIVEDNLRVAAEAGCLILAVKPQVLATVCREIAETVQASAPLIVSIAAGVRVEDIDASLGGGLAIVRVMPNQPALVSLGAAGLYANERCSGEDRMRAADIMGAVGSVLEVDNEDDIDTITAISGSGPAYFYLLIDILRENAVRLGFDEQAATTLAIDTARGAAALAAHEDAGMEELIARVRSPGGTTEAALDSLEAADVRAIFRDAIDAARRRATELADAAHDDLAKKTDG